MAVLELDTEIKAIISRGGRPYLAREVLGRVRVPTLFIVSGDDEIVLKLNREAVRGMKAKTELKIIPGASLLFEEPGTLEEVTRMAAELFTRYLLVDHTKG